MFLETFRLAVQAIARNALRSFLTMLGIVIGVGAVIAMVTIGNGTTASVEASLEGLGSNLLFVRPGQFGPGRPSSDAKSFNERDVEALKTQIAGLSGVAPVAQTSVTAIFGSQSRQTSVTGTDNDIFTVRDWQIIEGREFQASELAAGRAVCVIGDTVYEELFDGGDAIGQRFRVGKISCEVIGRLESKGQSGFGTDQDDTIIMPLHTVQRRIVGNDNIGTIYVSAADGVETSTVKADIEELLRDRRKISDGEEDDFSVNDMTEIAEASTSTLGLLTGLLAAIAGVSLLVGGIGIMNIMLVSVTERTREIGIRLAIGALEGQVLTQFLVEAVVLSGLGGVIGIALGLALGAVAANVLGIPLVIDPTIVLVAFAFSAVIGVVFGYFPARRAARLNPIDALRHE